MSFDTIDTFLFDAVVFATDTIVFDTIGLDTIVFKTIVHDSVVFDTVLYCSASKVHMSTSTCLLPYSAIEHC